LESASSRGKFGIRASKQSEIGAGSVVLKRELQNGVLVCIDRNPRDEVFSAAPHSTSNGNHGFTPLPPYRPCRCQVSRRTDYTLAAASVNRADASEQLAVRLTALICAGPTFLLCLISWRILPVSAAEEPSSIQWMGRKSIYDMSEPDCERFDNGSTQSHERLSVSRSRCGTPLLELNPRFRESQGRQICYPLKRRIKLLTELSNRVWCSKPRVGNFSATCYMRCRESYRGPDSNPQPFGQQLHRPRNSKRENRLHDFRPNGQLTASALGLDLFLTVLPCHSRAEA
jgi:hypothetical protein